MKHSIYFCGIFSSLKQNFIANRSSQVSWHPDCIFEIYQLWQSSFSRVYSNCCCSFEAEIIKIGQSSHKMYSNNIVNFQESTTILNACTKKGWKLIECTTHVLISPIVPQMSCSSNLYCLCLLFLMEYYTIKMDILSIYSYWYKKIK